MPTFTLEIDNYNSSADGPAWPRKRTVERTSLKALLKSIPAMRIPREGETVPANSSIYVVDHRGKVRAHCIVRDRAGSCRSFDKPRKPRVAIPLQPGPETKPA